MKKITDYNFPEDIKNMSENELNLLCVQIREFLIDKVSATGGHIASNLGVVELTVALFRKFDFPYDRIVWDVGHQSYVHKILSGRAKAFDTLRQLDGLSGFPKEKESVFDNYDTGHSSTSISACAGMAKARDIKGERNEVIAVIGDGALTGGMAYEALNNIGDSKSKVIVILNDNGISISPNIGGMSKHLANLRTSKSYRNLKAKIKNSSNDKVINYLRNAKNDIKYLAMGSGVIFEELGFTYFGPIDGHNIKELCDAFDKAKSLDEPILIHVITRKGKGYKNAELNPGKFHGIGPFDPETGMELSKRLKPSYSDLVNRFLVREADKDQRICAVTAAMKEATGLSDFSKVFPSRFFDCGIAEQHAVSFACGLAKEGMKPVVCIYSSFLQRAFDQVLIDCCMQKLPVVFLLDRAGCVGADGETHNGMFDISYLLMMPNMTVLTPKDGNQFEAMLRYALKLNGPCAIRYPRGETDYLDNVSAAYNGLNERIMRGNEVDIWACGKFFDLGQKVAEILKKDGISTGLVDVSIVKPMDISELNNSRVIVTLEDNVISGGFGEHLRAFAETTVLSYGWPDSFIPQGKVDELMERYGLTPEKIVEEIKEVL